MNDRSVKTNAEVTLEGLQPFDPNDHLMQIKNRNGSADYLPVAWRLVWFREACPQGEMKTELITLDLDRETEEEGYAWNNDTRRSEKVIKRANGYCPLQGDRQGWQGRKCHREYKSEKAASFSDFAEKAETGSIGRALAALGYGTQFAPELNEEHRIVDAPVDRGTASNDSNGNERRSIATVRTATVASNGKAKGTTAEDNPADTPATDQQLGQHT